MRRRRLAPLLAVGSVFALSMQALAPAAENFSCGPGGTPDPKTSKCSCPAGKIEKTTGGTSRCVDRPVTPKPTATTTTKPTTSTKPNPSTTTTTPPLPTSTATVPPVPTGTVIMPTTQCPASQVLVDGTCRDRCAPNETWNGYICAPNATTLPKPVQCDPGQFPDAAGHCCFAGQVWMEGAGGGSCRGTPSCPAGTTPQGETCAPLACLDGQQRASDNVHCCWTGQDWSSAVQRCVGAPSCPQGYTSEGDRCTPLRLCDPGMVAVDVQHCCYPNQHWMMRADGQVGCGGPPACPAPLVVAGEDCVAPGKLQDDADKATRVAMWGAGYVTFDINYQSVITSESTDSAAGKWSAYGFGMAIHTSGFPLRLTLGGFFGSGSINGASGDSTKVSGYAIGAAFAPLSLPSAIGGAFSVLNPWLGIDYRGWTTTAPTSFDAAAPDRSLSRGTATTINVGDMIIIKQFAFYVSYAKSIAGEGSVPSSTFTIGLGYLLSPAF